MIHATRNLAIYARVPAEPVRTAWCEWLHRHGIDPMDVAVPGDIARHEDARRVSYLAWQVDRDEDGRPVGVHHVTRNVQLEAAPMPFPEVTE